VFTGAGMLRPFYIDRIVRRREGRDPGQFVPAALTYSLIEGLLCQTMIQGTGLAMLELKKKVLAPVRVGDTVHAEVEVTSVRPTSKGNRGIVASKIDVKNQKGEVVISYEATRMLAGRATARRQRERASHARLKDRTVLVTGGANGIGAAIARRLAEKAARSVFRSRRRGGEKVASEIKAAGGRRASSTLPTTMGSRAASRPSRPPPARSRFWSTMPDGIVP
jgi:hypothetical protein